GLVVLAPLFSGLAGGVAVNAWKEYVASTIPERQRASLWALRFGIGTLFGLLAGKAVQYALDRFPGVTGYGVLHMFAAAFVFASLLVLSFTHEGNRNEALGKQSPARLRDSFAELPQLVRVDGSVRAYAMSRLGFNGFLIMAPFLGIHALEVLHKPDSYLGELVVANTMGSLAGFLLGGYSGDRHGGKRAMVLAHIGFIALCAWSPLATSEREFLWLFFLFGLSLSLATVATATLDLEIAPPERRPTYQALLGAFALVGVLLSTLISTLIRSYTHSFAPLALSAGVALSVSLMIALAIEEPRRRLLLGQR
ncbi:MAG TPA: MFS transporter, partial [Polyangiaceae bacterium]|nr:MFS transporter [Polyangiaceae bacterium]